MPFLHVPHLPDETRGGRVPPVQVGPEARHSETLKGSSGTDGEGQTRSRSNTHSGWAHKGRMTPCNLAKPFA